MQESQEEVLELLSKTKAIDALLDIADATACDDDEDCLLHPVLDGIYAGLGKSNKEVWTVEVDDGTYAIFIANSFDEVKGEIAQLPDLMTNEQIHSAIVDIKEAMKDKFLLGFREHDRTNMIVVFVPAENMDIKPWIKYKGYEISFSHVSASLLASGYRDERKKQLQEAGVDFVE